MNGDMRPVTITELIEQYHALLYRYAYRLCGSNADAEDLTQQTYLIAHENLHQLRDTASAKSWLCTILRHAFLRNQSRHLSSLPLEVEGNMASPAVETGCDEEAVQQALGELAEEYRSAVILYYFQELSYKEISEVMDIPLGTVMSRLSRGKLQLKSLLEAREARLKPAETPRREWMTVPAP